MDISSPDRPFRIGFLLVDGFGLMSYAAAREPLRAANRLSGRPLYEVRNVPATGGRAQSSTGAIVPADALIGEAFDYDLVLLVAGEDPFGFEVRLVAPWLRGLARRGTRLGGIAGGPAVLAMAGLMADRRMTLDWEHQRVLSEMGHGLTMERALYVIDRDRMTSAGGTAPADMMHAFLTERHGPGLAREVSDWLVHTQVRAPGDPPRSGLAERFGIDHPRLLRVIETMTEETGTALTLREWSTRAGLGERQLTRLFRQRLGTTPQAFHRALRLDRAAALLRQTPMPVSQVALATGFANFAHFSQAFAARFGASPRAYRRQRPRAGTDG